MISHCTEKRRNGRIVKNMGALWQAHCRRGATEGARCRRGSVQTNEICGRVTIGFPVLLMARSGEATGKRRYGRPALRAAIPTELPRPGRPAVCQLDSPRRVSPLTDIVIFGLHTDLLPHLLVKRVLALFQR